MGNLELIELELMNGVIKGVIKKDPIINKNNFSLKVRNETLNIEKNYSVQTSHINKELIAFCFEIKQINFMELTKGSFGNLDFQFELNSNKIYSLVIHQKHLENKIIYCFQPYIIKEDIAVLLDVRETKLSLVVDHSANIHKYQKTDKTIINNIFFNEKEHILSFYIKNYINTESTFNIVFIERKSKIEWVEKIVCEKFNNDGYVQLNLSNIIHHFYNQISRWDLYVEIKHINKVERSRLGQYNKKVDFKYNRYFPSAYIPGVNVLTPYLTDSNGLSLVINQLNSVKVEKLNIRMRIINFKMRKNIIKGIVVLKLEENIKASINSIVLKYRSNIEMIEYKFPVTEMLKRGSIRIVNFKLDISKLSLVNYYWDFYLDMNFEESDLLVRLRNPIKWVKKTVNKQSFMKSYRYENGFWVYPYITAVNTIALIYKEKSEHETFLYNMKERLAYMIYFVFKWYFDKKNIWLAYEKFSETAQDNAYYFFKYCYDNKKKNEFYYIIKKNSPDYENIISMGDKVLHYMTLKYMIYLFAAKLFISSESRSHAYDIRSQKGLLKKSLKHKKQVFLQHGVLGLKKVDYVYKKTGKNAVDLFVVSSESEKKIVKEKFGYREEEVIITGLSRWDVLVDQSHNNSSILLMPTWRSWMDDLPEEQFIQTEYYKQYVALLNSNRFYHLLEQYNIELNFFIHPKFKIYIDQFSSNNPRVKILQYGDVKVNQLLMESKLLITDYSSVAWDMYFQQKPIVFYQFDLEDYLKYQGSYLDMKTELFGDSAYTVSSLIELIKKYAENNFQEEEKYALLRKRYLKYTDHHNSRRIYQEILNRGV